MAGSGSDDLEDLLLQAGGAGKASNKRSRSEDVFADSDDETSGEDSYEVDQAPTRKAKAPGKRSKTADTNKADRADEIDEETFMFDGYGKSLIRDEEDRLRLDALSELDREMELSARAEQRDKRLEQLRNARLYKPAVQARTKHPPAAPRQAPREEADADADAASDKAEQMRSSTRLKRPDSGKVDAMAELRARRAQAQEKSTKSTKGASRKKGRRRSAEDDEDDDASYTDDEEISESDSDDQQLPSASAHEPSASDLSGQSPRRMSSDEEDDRRHDQRYSRDERYPRDRMAMDEEDDGGDVQASNTELLALQIKRSRLEKWIKEPFFEKTVIGCLVKVAYASKYHVAEIVDVTKRETGRHRDMGVNMTYPYAFGGGNTFKALVIRRGSDDRICPMTQVSNQVIDTREMDGLVAYNEKQRMPYIMRSNVDKQKALLQAAENYTYTSEDVNKMLAEKRARGAQRGMNSVVEKARLTRLRDHALESNDTEQVQQLEQELQQIEAQLADAERNANKRGFGMSNVNERNKKTNFLNAYKNVSSAPDNQKVSATGADAFSRRKTQSKVYWSTVPKAKRDELQAAAAAAGITVQINADGTAVLPAAATDGVSLAGIEVPAAAVRTNADGDVIDLDIDMSVMEAIPEHVIKAKKLLGPQYPFRPKTTANLGSKQLLSFAEYSSHVTSF